MPFSHQHPATALHVAAFFELASGMPKPSSQILLWSEEHLGYDLHIHGRRQRSFHRQDEPAWFAWVQEQTAFAFQGQAGHLSVIKEARSRDSQ